VRVKLHGGKGNLCGKIEEFLQLVFGTTRETKVLEFEGRHSGHV
jgi:hypothetical protein